MGTLWELGTGLVGVGWRLGEQEEPIVHLNLEASTLCDAHGSRGVGSGTDFMA